MGQFHQKGSWPTLMFQINDDGYYVDRQLHGMTRELKKILTLDDMKGKWNDILIHINSTKKDSGFYKIWVNAKLKYEYNGQVSKGKENFFKFGIYQTYLSSWALRKTKPYPTQVVYYDEIRFGKTREKVTKYLGN